MSAKRRDKVNLSKLLAFSTIFMVISSYFQVVAAASTAASMDLVRMMFSQLAFIIFATGLWLVIPRRLRRFYGTIIVFFYFYQFISLHFLGDSFGLEFGLSNPLSLVAYEYYFRYEVWPHVVYFFTILAVSIFLMNYLYRYFWWCLMWQREFLTLACLLLFIDFVLPTHPFSLTRRSLNIVTYHFSKVVAVVKKQENTAQVQSFAVDQLKRSLVVLNAQGLSFDQRHFNLMKKTQERANEKKSYLMPILVGGDKNKWGVKALCRTRSLCLPHEYKKQGIPTYYLSAFELSQSEEEILSEIGFEHFVTPDFKVAKLVAKKPLLANHRELLKISLGLLKKSKEPLFIYIDTLFLLRPYLSEIKKGSGPFSHVYVDDLVDLYLKQLRIELMSDRVDIFVYSTQPDPLLKGLHPLGIYSGHFELIKTSIKKELREKALMVSKEDIPLALNELLHDRIFSPGKYFIDDDIDLKTLKFENRKISICTKKWGQCEELRTR